MTPRNITGQTTTTTGTGTLTLGAAITEADGRKLVALGAGDNALLFSTLIVASNGECEVSEGCTYTHSGTTITRGTLKTSTTGSRLDLPSGTHKVYIVPTAAELAPIRGFIEGGVVTYSSTTAIAISACTLAINGKVLSAAAATLTSGSTMKDVAGSTVTIGASKRYHVFAYDNAGTLEFRVEERDGSGDGNTPTWDADLDYYKAATTGAAARRIGAFWTSSGSAVMNMTSVVAGRMRAYQWHNKDEASYSTGNATSYTSITLTPWSDPADYKLTLTVTLHLSSGSGLTAGLISTNSGTNDTAFFGTDAVSGGYYGLGFVVITRPSTLHYKTLVSTNYLYLAFLGAELMA